MQTRINVHHTSTTYTHGNQILPINTFPSTAKALPQPLSTHRTTISLFMSFQRLEKVPRVPYCARYRARRLKHPRWRYQPPTLTPSSSPTLKTPDSKIWDLPAPALPSRGCDFVSHPLFLSYHHDDRYDSYKDHSGANRRGISIPGPLYAICYAYAIIRHHRIPRKLATSYTCIPTKVNVFGHNRQPRNHQETPPEVSQPAEHVYDVIEGSRRRLHFDLNTDTTLSSYPRFRTPYTAPEYAEPFVLAFFGSLIPFPALTDSAGAIFGSFAVVCTPFPPHPYLHVPSASGTHPIASEDTQDGEFAILVVPEAKERASGCQVYKDRHCADTTIVFGDLENPRIVILGLSMACVIIEQLRLEKRNYEEAGRVGRRRESGKGMGYTATWFLSPRLRHLRYPSSPWKGLKSPPHHVPAPLPKSTYPAPINSPEATRRALLGVF
ncbi:hypothetical protein Moror_15778 [Moniliophthora roreri MCA 2997]|uniref:Uncharacterized protein n=1 Tax=Moniliophthora roreri (strain MCA 2997) TaxID=1381753 RepID=V2XN08_MONRO|nr:hypothetical protein Moror_15778 [Moniliophthora roreri MCA 2997]